MPAAEAEGEVVSELASKDSTTPETTTDTADVTTTTVGVVREDNISYGVVGAGAGLTLAVLLIYIYKRLADKKASAAFVVP